MSKPEAALPSQSEGALKRLREISQVEATFDHVESFFDQVRSEKNERGAAILLAANVEVALRKALTGRLSIAKVDYESLFGNNSPMGSFANKTRIAHALEIIGNKTRKNLDLIRAIRNAFAHAQVPITFATKEVANVCDLLVVPPLEEVWPPRAIRIDKNGNIVSADIPKDARDKFRIVCELTAHNLLIYSSRCLQVHRPPPQDDRYEITMRPRPLP